MKIDTELQRITDEAVYAYNTVLAKPNGLLAAVYLMGSVRRMQVKRALEVASEACKLLYGAPDIVAQFWTDYFGECDNDDWLRGAGPYGGGHERWLPSFEYLMRPSVITRVVEKSISERVQ